MSREIKFRAWDKEEKEMFNWDNKKFRMVFNQVLERPEMEVMQFTGLKDISKKIDVYEADIVEAKWWDGFTNHKGIFKIVRGKTKPAFQLEDPDGMIDDLGFNTKLRILGNIHQNPELLKK